MPNMTMSLPPELHQRMRAHPEIKWTEIARSAIEARLDDIESGIPVIVVKGFRPRMKLKNKVFRRSDKPNPDFDALGL
ncbi:MAG TPA: hypothetical protein VI893_05535 [Thermoplasmata archaeon]|nr:hypothetical protein [Thermoplasmata archaeon]